MDDNPLRRLIRDAMAEQGWTYSDLARACGIPRSTAYALSNKTEQRTTNRPATLQKLADGLGIPIAEIRAAAAASAGYATVNADSIAPDEVKVFTQLASELTLQQRQQLLALAQMMHDDNQPKKRGRGGKAQQ